jgi:hypothetical protein
MTIAHFKVWRGAKIEIPFAFDEHPGSPSPILRFTLAESRDASTKLLELDVEHVDADPLTYHVCLGPDVTNRDLGTYWWDIWRLDIGDDDENDQPLAQGSLKIQGVVRLP